MFEKEAIRHAFEVTIGLDCLIKPVEEFTYEELNDHLQEKADDFQDGAEFGYNKANEWHYVKDGDLPPLRKEVLWCVDEQLCLGELIETRIDFGEWELDSVLFNDYEIAWKEIVLPKEIKEK